MKLTKLEKTFAEVYTLLHLPGTAGHLVPFLVPSDTLKGFDVVINDENLESETNFLQTESGKLYYRTAEALNVFPEKFV